MSGLGDNLQGWLRVPHPYQAKSINGPQSCPKLREGRVVLALSGMGGIRDG